MPPLPTINDTYRITLLWGAVDGVTPRNVIHVRDATDTVDAVLADLDAGIAAMADPSHLFHCCDDSQACFEVLILPLNGVSGGQVRSLATPLTGGSGTGPTIPQSAAIVSLYTLRRGPRGRGRVFAGPISEGSTDNGVVGLTSKGLMETAWDDFAAGINSQPGGPNLVVASYAHSSAQDVNNIVVQNICGTQKRRIAQLR